jgi:orotidine-5'-phosphate decarboxylase
MNPIEKYNQRAEKSNSLICVGLDSEISKIPEHFKAMDFPQFEFNKYIIEATHEFSAAYKPNIAFYEARGDQGMRELKMTMEYLQQYYPDIFTICDAKRADIGSTNGGYVAAIFDWLGFDAITLHPYLGKEALKPFLDRQDKVSIILCRTSNPGAGELQDLKSDDKPLWQIVAEKVSSDWNKNNNCMLVTGATYPEELTAVRKIVGDMALLVPGIGAQGGDVEKTVKAGLNSTKQGMIISSSRGIIFAEDPALEAKKLRDEINQFR